MLRLGAGEVHVWYLDPEEITAPAQIRRCFEMMSDQECARWQHFVFAKHRHAHLVAKALVRSTLSRYASVDPCRWTFATGRNGKPRIDGPLSDLPLEFNLSHTTGLVAIAVTRLGEVGLDVEWLQNARDTHEIARRCFTPLEVATLESSAPTEQPRRFLEYWTLKEAYIKATGEGLSADLQRFWFRATNPPALVFPASSNRDAAAWQCAQLDLGPEHVAALAVQTRSHPLLTSLNHACL